MGRGGKGLVDTAFGDPSPIPASPLSQRRPERRWVVECPNCGNDFEASNAQASYCGARCRGEAKAVRYLRARHAEYPSGLPRDVLEAAKMKMAHALGGGYDQNARRLSPATRLEVRRSAQGQCERCGQPGTQIDHIEGSSPDLSNLRLLCKGCHDEITHSRMRPIVDAETKRRRDELLIRVHADQPLLPSDAVDWESRRSAWLRDHRRSLGADHPS